MHQGHQSPGKLFRSPLQMLAIAVYHEFNGLHVLMHLQVCAVRTGQTWVAPCRYRDFWVTSNVFLARLYCSPLVTIAAIKGACPAGGCCLSLCCDLRIMTEQADLHQLPPKLMHISSGADMMNSFG